ncbi:hypothetical protein ACVW0P_003439 [Mucilaginibacter sp. UYNi724]
MSKVLPVNHLRETLLYQELIKRHNLDTEVLIANIVTVCDEACSRAKLIPKYFPEFTLHDQTHFLRVTQLMSLVIGRSIQQLNDVEITLLILSAFFHDQGMLFSDIEFAEIEKDDQFTIFKENWFIDHPNYFETKSQAEDRTISPAEAARVSKIVHSLEAAMLTDYLRVNHGQRSFDLINETYAQDKRLEIGGMNLSHILGVICLSHTQSCEWITPENGLNFDENIGTYRVNTAFVAVVLRLADILDFDADRTPDVLFRSIHFTSPVSVIEWQKHRSVQGWEISPNMIRFTMAFEHPVYEKSARNFLDWIDYELTVAHKLIRNSPKDIIGYQLNIPEKTNRDRLTAKGNKYIFNDIEFSLSRDEVVKLLMTNNLYKSPSLFIRELLQNSLDALRLRKANFQKDGLTWDQGKVFFHHYIDQNGEHIVECVDNGCGMDVEVISKFFGKVGRSYYRSPEFQRHRLRLKEKGVDFEPCSQFGIGFMSCFMIGDRIEIFTRKDYGAGKELGKPLNIEINGLGGLMVIREGQGNQPIGTTIKVYNRERPLIYDSYSDNIRLLLVLNGYVLANDFLVEAKCDIPSIRGTVSIEPIIDKKTTFLEERKVAAIRTYEIDLRTINPNLYGYLRQSFLIDSDGKLCLENDEAKWIIAGDNDFKDKPLRIALQTKSTGEFHKFGHHFREEHSVCLDGILISGAPGRSFHERYEMMDLGWRNPMVHSEHPFTIDVRGDIKPEITPAREQPESSGLFNQPSGWRRLQYFLSLGSGDLWEQVLQETKSSELFWQLLLIYRGSPHNVFSHSIKRYLSLPTSEGSWIKISDINIVRIADDTIFVETYDKKNHIIELPENITKFNKTENTPIDWTYWVQNILTGLCQIQLLNDDLVLMLRNDFEPLERPNDIKIRAAHSNCRCLKFTGLDKTYLCATKFDEIVNLESPIVQLGYDTYLNQKKDNLQEFAASLILVVPSFIRDLKQANREITLQLKGRSLKFLGAKYLRVNWSSYDTHFMPPYNIYVNSENTLNVTDEILRSWADQVISDED